MFPFTLEGGCAVLTTKGYVEVRDLPFENCELIGLDGDLKVSHSRNFSVEPISDPPCRWLGLSTSLMRTIIPFPEDLLFLSKVDSYLGFTPLKACSYYNNLLTLGDIDENLFDVIYFPGIEQLWGLLAARPLSVLMKDPTNNLGVSPLVLIQQLGRTGHYKVLRGLLRSPRESRDRLICGSRFRTSSAYYKSFSSLADALNYSLLFSFKYHNTITSTAPKNKDVSVFRVGIYTDKMSKLLDYGLEFIRMRKERIVHNYYPCQVRSCVVLNSPFSVIIVDSFFVTPTFLG